MAVARASVTDIDLKAWPSARPGSLATYSGRVRHVRWLLTVPWTNDNQQVEPELHCFTCRRGQAVLLFSGYEARARWYPLLQGSRLAATAISVSILYSDVLFCAPSEACLLVRLLKLASAISSPRAWVTGRRNRQCCRSSLSSDFDDVCHCDSVWRQMRWTKNEFEERMSTFVQTPALLWYSHSMWQRLEDSRNALVVSCGYVQLGDSGRSKETLRALACRRFSSSLPEGALLSTAHPAVHLEMRRWYGANQQDWPLF